MSKHLAIFLAPLTMLLSSAHAEPGIARVSALATGRLLLGGMPSDLAAIETEFQRLRSTNGSVWYYRENAHTEPRPEAMKVIELMIKYRLPVSISTKADFSDYVDGNGQSMQRRP